MQPAVFKIGITGTLGTGKSTVGKILQDLGVLVLDTDEVVHQLYARPEVVDWICLAFGEAMRTPENTVDRKRLGELVFNDAQQKQQLEAFIHPLVRQRTENFLNGPVQTPTKAVSIRAALVPLLFEANSQSLYDEVWCVVVEPESLLVERLKQRHPDWPELEIQNRLSKQWPQSKKAALSQQVIANNASVLELTQQVQAQLKRLQSQLAVGELH